MGSVRRFVEEYGSLRRVLSARDFAALMVATAGNTPAILRTGKLTSVDMGMSRNLVIRFYGSRIALPLLDMDRALARTSDNPSFGAVREMCARDCYLRFLNLPKPAGTVIDLGANRGMFSLLALTALGADRVIGVEPQSKYEAVMAMLLIANGISPDRSVRYTRFIASKSAEKQDPVANVSIETICQEQRLDKIGFMKIDIEGGEKQIFSEPGWLARVDNLAMELHPGMVGDLSLIPRALEGHGFLYRLTNESGEACDDVNHAAFAYASRTGALV